MCATKAMLLMFFAVVAVAVAIPATLPQAPPVGAPAAIEQRNDALENGDIGPLAEGAELNQDLKGSSSYGYGYYGPYHYGYPHYGYRYGYPYGYGGYYPYRSYWGGYYRPYYGYYW